MDRSIYTLEPKLREEISESKFRIQKSRDMLETRKGNGKFANNALMFLGFFVGAILVLSFSSQDFHEWFPLILGILIVLAALAFYNFLSAKIYRRKFLKILSQEQQRYQQLAQKVAEEYRELPIGDLIVADDLTVSFWAGDDQRYTMSFTTKEVRFRNDQGMGLFKPSAMDD